ncbi:MAG: glycoside hydrolase family 15 protein [Acidimicrobiales bacterium]
MNKHEEPGPPGPGGEVARLVASSVATMLKNQSSSGAFIASPDFAEYQYCWLRDGSFTAYALDCAGEHEASRAFHEWSAAAIEGIAPAIEHALDRRAAGEPVDPRRMPPARFSLSGCPVGDDWPNFQIDGYGTWLWSLQQHLDKSGEKALPSRLAPSVDSVGRYLVGFGTSPCYDVWEESGDSVHAATLGCVFAGLEAAASMLGRPAFAESADIVRSALVDQARRLGRFAKSDRDQQVDAALLWLCEPFHVVAPDEPAFAETLGRIVAELDFDGGVRRYPSDTYYGGGAWPVLTASLGWAHAAAGDLAGAQRCQDWVTDHFDDQGRLGEQFGGDRRDPEHYLDWVERWGRSAADLLWSHAMYVVLAIELAARNQAPAATTPATHALSTTHPEKKERNTT